MLCSAILANSIVKNNKADTFDWDNDKGADNFCDNIDTWFFEEDSEFGLAYKLSVLSQKDNIISNALRKEIDEQVEYLIDIEDINDDIANLYEEEIKKSEEYSDRYETLIKKSENGTITEEEKNELKEIQNILFNSNNEIEEKKQTLKSQQQTIKNKAVCSDDKINLARSYANKTYSLGSQLLEKKHDADISRSTEAADNLMQNINTFEKNDKLFK
jgi:hypothetical protein